MRIRIIMHGQDDPRKCTAARILRRQNASSVTRAAPTSLLLNPFAEKVLIYGDKKIARSLTAVDCSWRLAHGVFGEKPLPLHRRLPPLLAGNPVNYARAGKLTTAEALAGALYIMGFEKQAHVMLEGHKWGHTFFELNAHLLQDYARMASRDLLPGLLEEYGMAEYMH